MAPLSQPGTVEGRAHRGHQDGTLVPGASAHHPRRRVGRDSGYPVAHARTPPASRLLALALAFVLAVAAAAPRRRRSIRPGPCSADGRAAGAYPDLEALVPASYQGAPPETLDSGRNCSTDNLGSLASQGIREVRFAGGTWTFGAERAAVLAVFRTAGLTADALATSTWTAPRSRPGRTSPATSEPMIRGRAGHRLDTKTGERVQTVVVWPAAASDAVNVVITNDLPDARIQDAIDAFGDH